MLLFLRAVRYWTFTFFENSFVEILMPPYDGIRSWGLWEVIGSWELGPHEWYWSHYRERKGASVLSVSTKQRYEKMHACKPEADHHQTQDLPVPRSWTSQPLLLCETNVYYLNHPDYGISILEALMGSDKWMQSFSFIRQRGSMDKWQWWLPIKPRNCILMVKMLHFTLYILL